MSKKKRKLSEADDLTGMRFDRLVAVRCVGRVGKDHRWAWECKCDCGKTIVTLAKGLVRGTTRSCGCRQRDSVRKRNYKHGDTVRGHKTRLYKIYADMYKRCYVESCRGYKDYGKRGIYVCDEWRSSYDGDGYSNFKKWALENGYHDPAPGDAKKDRLSIDRIDVNGPYAPWNCRWIPLKEQGLNKRNNRHIRDTDGTILSYSQFERKYGIKKSYTTGFRIRKWSLNAILHEKKHPEMGLHKSNRKDRKGMYLDKNGFIRLIPNYHVRWED